MLNEEKIKVMNKLAMYENREGKKHLPVSRYYRSDYVGLALIKNFFLVTIGYAVALGAVVAYFSDYLMENIHRMDLFKTVEYILIGYGIVLVSYSLLTYIVYTVKYYLAKKSVRQYYQDLTALEKMYNREDRKPAPKKGRRK